METLTNLWTSWSMYDKTKTGILFLAIYIVVFLTIYYSTKNTKITILSLISLSLTYILNILGLILSIYVFKIDITEVFRLIPLISSILLLSNIGVFIGYFISKRNSKSFSYASIRKEYLTDTLKQTLFIVLLSLGTFLFVSIQTKVIIGISMTSVLISVWVIFFISRYFFKKND